MADEDARGHVVRLQQEAYRQRPQAKKRREPRGDWQDAFLLNSRGEPVANSQRNVELILENDAAWRDGLNYDVFADRIYKTAAPPYSHRCAGEEWADPDNYAYISWMARTYGFEPSRQALQGALVNVAGQRSFHPVQAYLHGLRWDGTARLVHWLRDGLGASDEPDYLAIVGRRWLMGAVARVMIPGCKMDTVLILEGRQGPGKSTALEVLFEPWFSDAPITLGHPDSYAATIGIWCQEMPELDALNKAETTASKAFFSQRRIRYRPPYGMHAADFLRQSVFAGTTNKRAYLRDDENRRYWPLFCTCIDLDWLREHKDQLLAEALIAWRAGEPKPDHERLPDERWWIGADEAAALTLARAAVGQRRVGDAWEDALDDYLHASTADFHTVRDLFTEAIKLDLNHHQSQHDQRLAQAMKAIGWEPGRRYVQVGAVKKQRRGYVREA